VAIGLDQIVAATRIRVAERKRATDIRALEKAAVAHQPRGFRRLLAERSASRQSSWAIIAEIKKASPSKGVLRAKLDVEAVAAAYARGGATALSVLTEQDFFLGSLENLCRASAACPLPCLRKDFIVDDFQLLEARANSADAVLLMCSVLADAELDRLYRRATELQLDVLCEAHDRVELERALAAGCNVVGVNSRDLRSFHVDLETPLKLAAQIPDKVLKVAESGIHSGADMARLRQAGYQAFLIGESLITRDDPAQALRQLLADADVAAAAHAV